MTTSVDTSSAGRNPDAEIGERVHTIMWRERLTQGAVAEKVGLTQSALSRKLRGDRPWTVTELYAIADVLGHSLAELLGIQESPRPDDPNGGVPCAIRDSNPEPAD